MVRLCALVLTCSLVAASCSGSDAVTAENSPLNDAQANAPIEQIDTASGGVASGSIDGLLTIQPSFGFGAYAVSSQSGQALAIPGIAAVETVDRNNDVIVSGDSAYALGFKPRDGQTFANDMSVLKFDYATGEVRQLAALGFDRETDDDAYAVSHHLHGVAGTSLLVAEGDLFGDMATYTVYDTETGAEIASFETPWFEFEFATGSCAGSINNLVGLSDGRMAGVAFGWPAILDLETGDIELLRGCDQDVLKMSDIVSVAKATEYTVFDVGAAPTDEDLAGLLDVELDLSSNAGFVEGGGDLWWLQVATTSVGETEAIVGGLVQFDLAAGAVEAVHALGVHLQRDLQQSAELRYLDGRIVIMDLAENGAMLIFDPATSAVAAISLDLNGADYTAAKLLRGDPEAVWIEVRRMTIISDDENGRQAAGDTYLELVDVQAEQITLSLAGEDLFG